jgi:hypothetical protein
MKKLKRLLPEAPFTSRISGGALALFSISALLFGATAAHAACGLTGMGSKSPILLPMLAQAGNDQQEGFARDPGSIVGSVARRLLRKRQYIQRDVRSMAQRWNRV